jgi:hypothetical protein
VKAWLHDVLPTAYALGLGKSAALALGADGQVEIWGSKDVTILLSQMPSE